MFLLFFLQLKKLTNLKKQLKTNDSVDLEDTENSPFNYKN